MESIESSSSKIPLSSNPTVLHTTPTKKLAVQSAEINDTALEKKSPTVAYTTPRKTGKQSTTVDGTSLELETPEKSNPLPRVQNPNVALSGKDAKKKILLSLDREELDEPDTDSSSSSDGELQDEERSSSHGLKSVVELEASVKLPERFENLCQFFCTLTSLIPLIRMRRTLPTLTNITPKLESLTGRRFTMRHLTQLQCILPEAILVKRILIRDEQTECMEEELLLRIVPDALIKSGDQDLKTVVRAHVNDWLKSHSEEVDVWEEEEELPSLNTHNPHLVVPASHFALAKDDRASFCKKTSSIGCKVEATSDH